MDFPLVFLGLLIWLNAAREVLGAGLNWDTWDSSPYGFWIWRTQASGSIIWGQALMYECFLSLCWSHICWWSIGQSKIQHGGERYASDWYRKLWFTGGGVVIHWTKYHNHTASDRTKILESFPEAWKYKTHQLNTSECTDDISMNNIRHFGIKLLFCWLSEHRQIWGKRGFMNLLVLAEQWLLLRIPPHKNKQVLRNLCLPFTYGGSVHPVPRQRDTLICSE